MISDTLDRCYAASGWVSKSPADDYWYEPRGIETTAGVDIDEDSALAITTVYACVAKISKTEASLPVSVVERTGPNTRMPVDHPLVELLTTAANEEATGMSARETSAANRELWGGSHYWVDWNQRTKEPVRLTHIPAREMEAKRDEDGNLYWLRSPQGSATREVLPTDRVWYTPGLSINGVTGLSTVSYNRELCGVAKASQQFKAAFFGNGAWAGGFIKRPLEAPEFSQEKAERWLQSLNEKFRGAAKAFGFGLLRENMEFQQIEMPFKDLAWLDMEKPSRIAICGWFDVPLIMIHDDEHASFHNSEQADIAFAKHSVLPRCLRVEMSARRMFFQGTKLYLKHNLAGLVRADFKTQMEAFAVGRQWGIFSINDCRALLDLNPIDGGDEYLTPLNMVPVGTQRPAVIPPPDDEEPKQALLPAPKQPDALATLRPSIEHAAERIAARQIKAATTAFQKHARGGTAETFQAWATKFFGNHVKVVRAEFEPILRGYEEATGERLDVTAQDVAEAHCAKSASALQSAVGACGGDYSMGIAWELDYWRDNLAAEIVERLTNLITKEAANALT